MPNGERRVQNVARRQWRQMGLAVVQLLCGIAGSAAAQNVPEARPRPGYPPLSSLVELGRQQVSIGSEDRVGPTLFGEISDVALDRDLNIYVLDRTTHSVRTFSRTGQFIGSAGRAGRGPGDLSFPLSLFHDGASRLYVFDHVNGMVVFETRDGILTHLRSFGAEYRPKSACALGDVVVVPGWRDKKILHVINAAGERVRSFGEGFRFTNDTSETLREMASRMTHRVFCDAEQGRIFVAAGALGFVRAYDASGNLLWEQTLPDYQGARFVMTQQGATGIFPRTTTSSVQRVGRDLLLVQARHLEPVKSPQVNAFGGRGSWEEREIVTYVLSARTGELLTRAGGAPVLGAVRANIALGYEQNPFPRVFLLPLNALGRE